VNVSISGLDWDFRSRMSLTIVYCRSSPSCALWRHPMKHKNPAFTRRLISASVSMFRQFDADSDSDPVSARYRPFSEQPPMHPVAHENEVVGASGRSPMSDFRLCQRATDTSPLRCRCFRSRSNILRASAKHSMLDQRILIFR
jgi:hypothetical protein